MSVQDTSLFSYFGEALPNTNKNHQKILGVLKNGRQQDYTNMEIANFLGWSINRITPRVYELRGLEKDSLLYGLPPLVVQSTVRKCRITGRQALAWRLRGR